MEKYILTLAIILASAIIGKTQDITSMSIRWNSNRFFDATAKVWQEEATYLVTQGTAKIQWFNANGSLRTSIQVAEVIGEWNDIKLPGLIQYEGTEINGSCSITIQKNAQEIKVLLLINGGAPLVYELLVASNHVL